MRIKERFKSKKLKNVNQAPGKVVYVGEKDQLATTYEVITYDKSKHDSYTTNDLETVFERWEEDKITWVNINGLSNAKVIETLGTRFQLHPLVLEDIANTQQRPKLDEYDDYIFLVAKMLFIQDDTLVNEHVSFVVGPNYVLTFEESENDVFDKLRGRLKSQLSRMRSANSDYLMYALLDAIVDNYFTVIETLGEHIENLENLIFMGDADDDTVQDIQALRPEIIQIRRAIHPLRDVTSHLEKSSHELISSRTFNYLRDLHDHSIQVSEDVEVYREMIGSLRDLYISTISNKMNEVMKVLTIMASIFIPLTFIAGVYGMNFDNMPELHMKYGYFYVMGIMLAIGLLMLWYFKRKKWF